MELHMYKFEHYDNCCFATVLQYSDSVVGFDPILENIHHKL